MRRLWHIALLLCFAGGAFGNIPRKVYVGPSGHDDLPGQMTWKLCGPDLNGRYGGMNGAGGLEAAATGLGYFSPTVNDARGNVLGTCDPEHGTVTWSASRPTGYGAVPGYRPLPLGHGGSYAQSAAWRGKWADVTGYIYIGKRFYDPVAGMWLSPDPVWNPQDPSYWSYCGGDPINHFDPDGKCIEGMANDVYGIGSRAVNGIVQAGAIGSDMIGQSAASLFGYGADYQGYSRLYQSIYNNPSAGPTGGQILAGTLQTEANIGTLGLYGMAQGYYNAFTTGDYSQAQDASLNALLLSGGTRAMQSQGFNPWSAGYIPNAADQAVLSYITGNTPAQFTQADVQAAIAQLGTRGVQTTEVQSSIDPNQVIRIAQAMQSGAFQNALMDSPVIVDSTTGAILAGHHRIIAAEMTGFNLNVNSIPASVSTTLPLSGVPLQVGRVNPAITVP